MPLTTNRTLLGLVACCAWGLAGAAWSGEQAERAIAAVNALLAAGEVPKNASIRVAFKSGNINALLGTGLELQKEWEQKTGVIVTARVVPQQAALTTFRENADVDLTVARTHEFPDLVKQELIADLGPMLARFGFSVSGRLPDGYVRPRLQGQFGDRLVAIPADGDVTIYFLRRDLLEDPAERAAFRKAHGRDLAPPATWQDYDRLVRFFHRPDKGLYGAAEERDRSGGWMMWLPRYLDQGAPYRPLFDERMRPLIDSPAGVAATESYVRTVRYSPPDILADGKDYSYTLPLFMQGKAFSTVNTIAGAKLFNSPGSAVRGKFMAIPIPGQRVGRQVVRNNIPIYGNNLVVSSRGDNRLLAFLFVMWLTDPDNSVRTVGATGGFTDPYRWHHLGERRIVDLYTAEALKVFKGEWEVALPPGTGVSGDGEYLDVLDRHLWLAARGEIAPVDAMRRTAVEWEAITERYGRGRQIELLKAFNRGFAATDLPSSGAGGR